MTLFFGRYPQPAFRPLRSLPAWQASWWCDSSPLARGQARHMGHHSGQYACSVLPQCLRSFCSWRRRTCRLSEGGQVFLFPPELSFCTNRARNSEGNSSLLFGIFSLRWVGGWVPLQAMRARRHSCFSASLSHFNGSMRYDTNTRVFCRTRRRAGPLAIPTWHLLSVLALWHFTPFGKNNIIFIRHFRNNTRMRTCRMTIKTAKHS